MKLKILKRQWSRFLLLSLIFPLFLGGCSTEGIIAASVGSAIVGGSTPTNEIQQVYYLGMFDPENQLPPTVYRVTVHGQASAISQMKFGSGWLPARLVDSLSTQIKFNNTSGDVEFSGNGANDPMADLKTGRRLVLFGPEGFREAPKDFRLAIVMGSSPEAFFSAIDETLGTVSQVKAEQLNTEIKSKLMQALVRAKGEKEDLNDLKLDVKLGLQAAGK